MKLKTSIKVNHQFVQFLVAYSLLVDRCILQTAKKKKKKRLFINAIISHMCQCIKTNHIEENNLVMLILELLVMKKQQKPERRWGWRGGQQHAGELKGILVAIDYAVEAEISSEGRCVFQDADVGIHQKLKINGHQHPVLVHLSRSFQVRV